ncbi:MAG TPA: hypothetical protein VNH11_31975 [Pirellulales bacterium]|nr:hypothetical protein [Pirellulales bacterium]
MTSYSIDQLSEVTALETPVRLVDPKTSAAFVLLSAEQYEKVRALLDDDDFDISEAYPLMDEVARSEGWDDPEMDIYNQFREPKE